MKKNPKEMTLSPHGRNKILHHEGGHNLKKYVDDSGKQHIGVGHLIKVGEIFPNQITLNESEMLFDADLKWSIDAVKKHVKVPLTQNQFDALVSFVYNIGESQFKTSSVLKNINAGIQGETIKENFLAWNRPPSAFARRKKEVELYFT
ncbi:lysozyme [Cytophagales bacterium LB-30]|uniref:Lysozyme n=1 Tax=Shiella aurantiaca TaxID=3058365 RepID=A0ABT8F0P1_9BACT|nr:lysozyme [Shiella aurantiaca]MDN4163958.1 lysozyme [Shiella aurantiaca]